MLTATSNVILVVDDQPTNLKLLFNLLQASDFKVLVAKTGESAINKLQKVLPDLILLDVMMPGMDGFETCRRLKASVTGKDIPVIFMTALSESMDKLKGLNVGAVDYITKPFQQDEVLARIKCQLKLRELQKQLSEQNVCLRQEIEERRQSEVREREKATQLELALKELKRTQAQLIQTEKMSGLGQMVAGVAHEINNPISFIYGNLTHIRRYIGDLLRLIESYQQTYPSTPEIQQLAAEIDLEFLVEDWQKLINSMQVGSERIEEIVKSLQVSSRHSPLNLKSIDIHEDIERTLLILQPRLKAVGGIEVIRNYSQLPLIACYDNQLNQVFLNLLNNAIDALETQPLPRVVTITTEVGTEIEIPESKEAGDAHSPTHKGHVVIRIADNGPGISEAVQKKMFEPFFTTKTVGSGMGLGLSVSYQIVVEKHKGQISCVSALGKGTELILEIPTRVY